MSMKQVEVIECVTARQFVNELEPSHERWAKNKWRHGWIFRGHSDTNWRLIPSALRTEQEAASEQMVIARELGSNIEDLVDAKQFLQDAYQFVEKYDLHHLSYLLVQLYAEIRNLREFFELADTLNLNSSTPILSEFHVFGTDFAKEYITNINNSDFMFKRWGIAPIAIAQHHGVATRLLDWTKNPLYAAFFACEGVNQTSTHIAVYAVHTFYLDHARDEIRLIEVNKGHSTYIHSQEGVFTLDTKADIEFLKTGVWRSILDYSTGLGTTYKFTLPVTELPELARILWLKRVTKAHMMPSLDNVIVALNTKWNWMRKHPNND